MQQFPRLRALGAALRRLAARLKDFPGDRRGSAVVYVAAIAVPLVTIVGVSIDAARGYLVKSKLSQALDAAGLAGGRVALSDTRDADIRMYFSTNFPPGYMEATLGTNDPQIAMDANAEELTLSATATIPTTFMRILGHNDMTVRASNVIHRTVKGMELALVMDNTGSMTTNNRMGLMKAIGDRARQHPVRQPRDRAQFLDLARPLCRGRQYRHAACRLDVHAELIHRCSITAWSRRRRASRERSDLARQGDDGSAARLLQRPARRHRRRHRQHGL